MEVSNTMQSTTKDRAVVQVPTELYMALVRLLDVVPPVLEDWIRTTGYGEVNSRDRAVLADVLRARVLHRLFLAQHGIVVEGVTV